MLFIAFEISSHVWHRFLFTPMQICSSINIEKRALHLVRNLLARVAVHLVHANGDLRTITFEQHARHLIRSLLVRVAVHLVHANANLLQSTLKSMLFISFEIYSHVSQSILFRPMQICSSITLEQRALHLVRNLLARVALHLVHAKPNLPSISLENAPHPVRCLLVRVEVHLVHANANILLNQP